jgi:hypothetical protein
MSSWARFRTATVGLTAAIIGLATWVATMATAPRYSCERSTEVAFGDQRNSRLVIADPAGGSGR